MNRLHATIRIHKPSRNRLYLGQSPSKPGDVNTNAHSERKLRWLCTVSANQLRAGLASNTVGGIRDYVLRAKTKDCTPHHRIVGIEARTAQTAKNIWRVLCHAPRLQDKACPKYLMISWILRLSTNNICHQHCRTGSTIRRCDIPRFAPTPIQRRYTYVALNQAHGKALQGFDQSRWE